MKKINQIVLTFKNEWEIIFKAFAVMLIVTLFISGCSVESKLNRSYKGKSFTEVMADRGAPTNIENLVGGGTIRSYVKKVILRATPINTGHFQYDKFDSPKMLKTEITQFFVDPAGNVKEIKYSCEYSK